MSWRTISSVIWSPHVLYSGIEMSSTKTSIFLPPGGPKVRPCRFSTLISICRWKMMGVVADEKETFFVSIVAWSCLPRYCSTVDVFAVPGPPMKSTARCCDADRWRQYSLRTESTVGTSSVANCSPTPPPGGSSHVGMSAPQWIQSPVVSSTLNSKIVSSASFASGMFLVIVRRYLSTRWRSLVSRMPATLQIIEKRKSRSVTSFCSASERASLPCSASSACSSVTHDVSRQTGVLYMHGEQSDCRKSSRPVVALVNRLSKCSCSPAGRPCTHDLTIGDQPRSAIDT
mmetsp:Transcript_69179/g.207492  ORF Transcript_69179/g.207492 Transcript_69179/m.207492 type:complete len:287 (+) Transcript_69179:143-1003(+)